MPKFICMIACALLFAVGAPTAADPAPGPVTREARAHWLTRDLIAWAAPDGAQVSLISAPGETPGAAESAHALAPAGRVDGALAAANPHLKGLQLYRITGASRAEIDRWLKGAVSVVARGGDGEIWATSGLQIGGVLDDLYANDSLLGVGFSNDVPTIRLWAPTAISVRLHLFDGPAGPEAATLPMMEDPATGVWRITGDRLWNRKYYLFEVAVFVPAEGRIITNLVTDPYSLNLSMDSTRSQIVNLDDADLKPAGWDELKRPLPEAPVDRAIYELHVRDFSISDATVPRAHAGKYLAFTDWRSNGMRRLRALAHAGLSDVHLLPTYDCATIPENPTAQKLPPDLSRYAAASEQQQALIGAIRDEDAFNWCYDPLHYLAPEGSYSSAANGVARILEFRRMVLGLSRSGLGTILDVVFNHTPAAGEAKYSVLDRIVPGYYYRLDEKGAIATSTCCANTASERAMMEKLMLDALLVWAREYKVSGFRFDLMGHHSRATILKARDRLRALTLAEDGVDGGHIYFYGEGWNFGEVADDARFVQATQRHMGEGTGVGTFNDRFRDAIRGGSVSDTGMAIVRAQGFASGLFTAPNALNRGGPAERTALLTLADHVRVGLAGSVAGVRLVTSDGREQRADALPFGGGSVGYVSAPQETVNYAEAHDNATLFDSDAYKLPRDTSPAERVRWQNLAASLIILAQGVPFLHAGQDMLRSKSLDRNSFNSGDWFNLLDFSMKTNGWGRGLPARQDNAANWAIDRQLLADRRLRVGPREIASAAAHVREMLAIRRSSRLFRLRTGQEVIDHVHFHNTGPAQVAGLIVMEIDGAAGEQVFVIVNATRQKQSFASGINRAFQLHPVQRASFDPVVRSAVYQHGYFVTPPLTTAVFVAKRRPD